MFSYDNIFSDYIRGAKSIVLKDPYIRKQHQLINFIKFCETLMNCHSVQKIKLVTSYDDNMQKEDIYVKLMDLKQSLLEQDIFLEVTHDTTFHDRELFIDNDWRVALGMGIDFFKAPDSFYSIGVYDQTLRKCRATKIDFHKLP